MAMKTIISKGEKTLDEVFENHKSEIYYQILTSIQENYSTLHSDPIQILKISTELVDYSINLDRNKFITSLNKCIKFFESTEEYEKCQECVDLISKIKINQ